MIGVRRGLLSGVVGVLVMCALLDARAGLGSVAWATGSTCAAVLALAAARRAASDGVRALGPADLVTLTRGALACGVAALVAESSTSGADVRHVLVPLAAAALALDFVDGRVARLTGTASPFGARLDGEADAFLILVLSVDVAGSAGAWVLSTGLVRYVYAVATWLVPWMQRDLPARYWRKVVAAYVGISLVLAAWGHAPAATTYAVLVVAVVLLAESFGWDVVWLWRRRVNPTEPQTVLLDRTPGRITPDGPPSDRP
ncbi:CDP-alcohol phosphatidyltransferase family protein [Nocardioides sp. Soil774]|uniref:CDP-alcohol phosphatidyltransferase family protein n=1 Tax=Nocardioides sp. Soil774 TaxID=1736408 RepID=UPI000AAF0F76|nr:CDP-alcohol phosphatidyltransferase family protein [Nocardioides sp. Soil774]